MFAVFVACIIYISKQPTIRALVQAEKPANLNEFEAKITPGVRAAFVMLAGPGCVPDAVRSLTMLDTHVLSHHPRPIYVFYGDDMAHAEIDELLQSLPGTVRKLVQSVPLFNFLEVPENVQNGTVENVAGHADPNWIDVFPGYQNMCRFQLIGILQQPIVQELDFYCRCAPF